METPVQLKAYSGAVTVTRTLYGPITDKRLEIEQKDAKRRAEMLDLSRPIQLNFVYANNFDPEEEEDETNDRRRKYGRKRSSKKNGEAQ